MSLLGSHWVCVFLKRVASRDMFASLHFGGFEIKENDGFVNLIPSPSRSATVFYVLCLFNRQNLELLRARSVFDHRYFSFLWNAMAVLLPSLPTSDVYPLNGEVMVQFPVRLLSFFVFCF